MAALQVVLLLGGWGCGGDDNTPPVAVNDSASVEPGGSVLIDVLANDSDADGDLLSIADTSLPQFGTLSINGDALLYRAADDFSGVDSFTYVATDWNGGTDSAAVTVTVGTVDPFNDPPVAEDDAATTPENTAVTTGDVLANDSDVDGDPLVIESFSQPGHGRVTSNDDGTFTYEPDDDWNGVDTFQYTVSDDRGGLDTANVNITVTPVGDDLYVAVDGDDDNPGTIDLPLATLERARDLLRESRDGGELPEGGAVVWLREGVHERTATFVLTAEDGGSLRAPLIFAAYPGETARVVGGTRLDTTDFSPATAESAPDVWHRIDPAAQDHLRQIQLGGAYTDDFGELTDRGFGYWTGGPAALELFFQQEPMQLARWPDADEELPFVEVAAAVSDTAFTYSGTRPDRWTEAEEVWFHGYWMYMWADRHMSAAAIDTATQTVTLTDVPGYGIADGQPYYALNLLEEITVPGEWYLDRTTGTLYFWPPDVLAGAEIFISLLEEPLVRLSDVSYVTFRDIVFEMGRAELVRIDGGANNGLERCVLRNAGLEGAIIDGGSDHSVERCEIAHTGNGGVRLSGGDRPSLTSARHAVRNCHIHHFSRWSWTYTPAVHVSGVGQTVSHNLMHDAPHTAILFNGNEHFLEYNEIRDVCRWASDAGAIYTGRDWGFRGNRVQYNFIHHVDSQFEGYGVHGIYLDDCVSGIRVFGNVLYEISGNAIQHGGGRDDLMQNNVIARCGVALAADSRGISRILDDGSDWDLLQKVIDVGYQDEPWATSYPALAAIPNSWAEVSAADALWLYPEGSIFSRNICFDNAEYMTSWDSGGTGTFDKYAEIAGNLEDSDPLFVDEAALDLTLAADSPAFDIDGFVAIPFAEIGIEPEE